MNHPAHTSSISQVNPARSLTLYAIGALLGLGIAGYSLFSARGTVTNSVPPEDLALVNQRPILRSDFLNQVESETGLKFEQTSRQDRLRVLDEMVREELQVQRALELDFAETDQDTRNALVAVVGAQMIADVTTSEPTEQQLLDHYQRHRDQYVNDGVMSVCNLVLRVSQAMSADAAMPAARAAVQALRAGSTLQQAMQRFGLINSNACDEDFYFAAKIHLGEALFEVARALPSGGGTSDPIVSADGIHILRMMKNAQPVPQTFAAAHDQVRSDYQMERETRIVDATMAFLRHRARIVIADDYAQDYRP
jgi:hypothetical protein